ncbi:MAG: hypothetical protein JF606_25750 [Burkholderiales bacterium]|nr:hypothetical protein [Burkholderiales bacterium]
MSKTAAIREAAMHLSISGRGTRWHIYGPWCNTDPRSPSTESTADSYCKAQIKAATWKARIALALMDGSRTTSTTRWTTPQMERGHRPPTLAARSTLAWPRSDV